MTATAHTLYQRLTHFAGAQSLPSYHDFTSQHAREQIRLRGLECVMCAERLNFEAFFEKCYGEKLDGKAPRLRKGAV